MPCNTGSAKLLPEVIYFDVIMMFVGIMDAMIWQMESSWAGLWERLLEKAQMTSVMSEQMVMFTSQ